MNSYTNSTPAPPFPLDGSSYTLASGDVDGDGRQEIIILNPRLPTLGVLSYLRYSDFDAAWPDASAGQIVDAWAAPGWVPGGWQIYPNDQYFVGDLDGDGCDEILVYQSLSGYLGVLKWDGTELAAKWVNQFIPTLNIEPGQCGFTMADVDGDGCAEAVLFDPASLTLAVLKWSDGAITVKWSVKTAVPGGLDLSAGDRLVAARLNVVPGDKQETIVVFSSVDLYLVALRWDLDQQQLAVYGTPSHNKIAPRSGQAWGMASVDAYLPGDFDGDGSAELMVYCVGANTYGLVEWQEGQFTVEWWVPRYDVFLTELFQEAWAGDIDGDGVSELVVTTLAAGPQPTTWIVFKWDGSAVAVSGIDEVEALSGALQLVADVDGDRHAEIVTVSPPSQVASVYRLGVTSSSASVTPFWTAQQTVAGVNPSFLAAAPANPFTPFTDDQAVIYALIGPSLNPPTTADVRAQYLNSDNATNFQGWGTQIGDAKNATPWPWSWMTGHAKSDIDAVFSTLASELGDVNTIYEHYSNMFNSVLDVNSRQTDDLITASASSMRPSRSSRAPRSRTGSVACLTRLSGVRPLSSQPKRASPSCSAFSPLSWAPYSIARRRRIAHHGQHVGLAGRHQRQVHRLEDGAIRAGSRNRQ